MDYVDAIVALIVVAAAVHGLRLGALVQVLSFGGFVLGVTIGALIAEALASSIRTTDVKTGVSLGLVIGLGVLLGIAGRIVGTWGNMAVRRARLGGIDSVAGVAVAIVAALFCVWLVANELAQTQYPWLNSAIQRSAVVRAVDNVMPPLPDVFSRIQTLLGGTNFPSVFSELEPSPTPVSVPTTAFAQSVAATAAKSTVKILGQACGYEQEGSGFVVSSGLVVTNAHVVAGERSTDVVVTGTSYPATVVSFDPTFDLAVLRTSAPLGPPLTLDPSTAARGTRGAIVGYPEDGPLVLRPAAVGEQLTAQGRNIYDEGTVVRQVYEIDADVEPGNSGGPLVAEGGKVIGVVFSRSTVYNDVGYALTSPGVLSQVNKAAHQTSAVGTGGCIAG